MQVHQNLALSFGDDKNSSFFLHAVAELTKEQGVLQWEQSYCCLQLWKMHPTKV